MQGFFYYLRYKRYMDVKDFGRFLLHMTQILLILKENAVTYFRIGKRQTLVDI